jgi:hypothetical protein
MLWEPWSLPDGAHRIPCLRRQRPQTALEATSLVGNDHSCLALEALCSSVNECLLGAWVQVSICIELDQRVHHKVHPASRLDIV